MNKRSNNWELIVTVGQCESFVIMAFIATIDFHIVAKYNLGNPLELKKDHFVLKCRVYVL